MSSSHDVQYLGSAILTRPMMSTGLGTLQRPLIELYAATYEPKTGTPLSLPIRRLTLTERGMIVTAIDATGAEEPDTFYAMPSVTFWEAVRFASVRVSDKKFRGAFEPLGELQQPKEIIYTDLDKQFCHLATQVKQHPALVVLVVRRTTGIKALELQAYACGSSRQAAFIVDSLRGAERSYSAQQASVTSVFSYNAFESSDVMTVAGGLHVINTVSPTSGARLADDMRRTPATVSVAGIYGIRSQPQAPCNQKPQNAAVTADAQLLTQSCVNLSAAAEAGPSVNNRLFVQDDMARAANSSGQIGVTAGGALEGYYDMPKAVALPIRGAAAGSSKPSLTPPQSRGKQEPPSRPVARSKTFRDTTSAVTDVSILHRPLIQRSSMDDGARLKLSSYADDRAVPDFDPNGKKPARTPTAYQPSSKDQRQQPAGGARRRWPSDQLQQPPLADKSQQPFKQSPQSGNRLQPSDAAHGSNPYDFLFGFDSSSAADKQQQQPSTAVADNKPVAMVQPRKVGGIRVLPENMIAPAQQRQDMEADYLPLSAAMAGAPGRRKQHLDVLPEEPSSSKKDPAPIAKSSAAVPRAGQNEEERRGSGGRKDKEDKSDGILSLRTIRGKPLAAGIGNGVSQMPLTAAPKTTDVNGNNLKTPIYGNIGVAAATTTSTASQMANVQSAHPVNNFDLLRAAAGGGTGSEDGSGGPSRNPNGPMRRADFEAGKATTNAPPGQMIVDGSEQMSYKDKEIASAIGDMRIDYEPSTATLQASGNNFEKYLGYLP